MRKLYVKNFGPIDEVNIELKSFNLFIGEQSIGKSTLAKLIVIFTDYVKLCHIIYKEKRWNEFLEDYNIDVYKDMLYQIKYEWTAWGNRKNNTLCVEINAGRVSVKCTKKGKEITDPQEITDEIIQQIPFKNLKRTLMAKSEEESSVSQEEIQELANKYLNNSIYIPTERNTLSIVSNILPVIYMANSSVPQTLLRFMQDFNNARSEYKDIEIPLLDIKYKKSDAGDRFVVIKTKDVYPLTIASSGIQSTLPLLLTLKFASEKRDYSSFVIEEPECNLFPDKQVELLRYILKTLQGKERIVTITTHSPYLLSATNNSLYAGYLSKQKGVKKETIRKLLPAKLQLNMETCSVYSLGVDANEGVYCKNLIDEETGMIDFNTLDKISMTLGEEFEKLEEIYSSMEDM